MDLKSTLKREYHASLSMLRQAVESCPEELWAETENPRAFWRIAYHALFYTHLYLGQNEAAYVPWAKHRPCENLNDTLPYWPPYGKQEVLEYWSLVDEMVDSVVDGLDLETDESGFDWYSISKVQHQMMNVRHVQEHCGQLHDRLLKFGIQVDWRA